jgi:hypothetical protein
MCRLPPFPWRRKRRSRSGEQNRPDVERTHWTITFAVILGWIEQKYVNVPAVVNVNEYFSSESSTFDLKTFSVLTTVCGISSRLSVDGHSQLRANQRQPHGVQQGR